MTQHNYAVLAAYLRGVLLERASLNFSQHAVSHSHVRSLHTAISLVHTAHRHIDYVPQLARPSTTNAIGAGPLDYMPGFSAENVVSGKK